MLRDSELARLPILTLPTAIGFLGDSDGGEPYVASCVQPTTFSAAIAARGACV